MRQLLEEIIEQLRFDLPGLAASFNPPATEEELRKAEEELGFSLPAELRELYQIHNGQSEDGPGFFFGLPFLSLEDMLAEWRIWAELEEEYAMEGGHYSVPAAWIKERYINRYWLPISKDWGGNHLGIDLDPDEKGVSGQVINFGRDEEVKYVVARRLTDFLQCIRDTAREGNYSVDQEEDYTSWSFGREGEVHFLDAIRGMNLPVLEPFRAASEVPDADVWFEGLDDQWKKRILESSSSPEAFLRRKKLLFIQQGLTNIAPLGSCSEVRELILSGNEIRSIEPLSGCKHLKRLYLVKNPVSDLRPLRGLEYLQELNLSGTAVTDVTPLGCLPKLTNLDIQHTPIRDFSPLSSIKGLRMLEVSEPDAEQLRSLSALTQLTELTLAGLGQVSESDLNAIGQLVNLQTLQLEGVSLPGLAFLGNCRRLQKIVIKDSTIGDVSVLAGLTKLQSLELNGCPDIGKLEELARSASLRKITASFQQFARLKDCFDRKIDFSTMIGEMTDEEEEIWHQYLTD